MSKKGLKKEIKRLNKIIDVLLKENRGVYKNDTHCGGTSLPLERNTFWGGVPDSLNTTTTTTSDDYIGGRPGDRG